MGGDATRVFMAAASGPQNARPKERRIGSNKSVFLAMAQFGVKRCLGMRA
jgi:hypothetical protein